MEKEKTAREQQNWVWGKERVYREGVILLDTKGRVTIGNPQPKPTSERSR